MKQQLESIRQKAIAALDNASTPAELEDLRVRLLGSCARGQLPKEQQEAFLDRREEILAVLKTRYSGVHLDMEARDGR